MVCRAVEIATRGSDVLRVVMEREKLEFAKNSLSKSEGFANDPMIRFVILWIGFNALYDNNNDDHEHEKVYNYFDTNADLLKPLIESEKTELEKIADFINQTHQHSRLNEFLRTRRGFLAVNIDRNGIRNFAEFVYKIRNNMFHSEKPWNQADETRLLEMVNPVFEKVLISFISKQEAIF